jgi:hypothetical protein
MTLLGKILLLFNLAFSVLLAGWAFTVYADRIDWTKKKGKASEFGPAAQSGEFAVRDERLKELQKNLGSAQVRWRVARANLRDEEARRVADRIWSENEMKHLTKTATPDKDPVGEMVVAAKDDPAKGLRKGQVELNDKGEPQLVPAKDAAGNPLGSLDAYNDKDAKTLQSLDQVLARLNAQIEEANKLTDQIIGAKDAAGNVVSRGLHERIRDEKAKRAGVVAEQALLRPQLINTVVDAQLLKKRRDALKKRVEELKKIGVASGG